MYDDVYNVRTGMIFASVWSFGLICGIITIASSENESKFAVLGPSEMVSFAGFPINNWKKWTYVMCFSMTSQIADSVVSATLNPFVTNVIKDHKTVNKGPIWRAHTIVQIRAIFHWLNEIGSIYVWITMQIQFIIPMMITDLVIRYFTTRNYLNMAQPIL